MSLDDPTREQIDSLIKSHDVMLFMKGNRQAPQCGFSATVVQILDQLAPEYGTADVLADPALREGIKAYSSWPTVPQLYVKGEFIGGCDIIQELYASGELFETFGISVGDGPAPEVTITPTAADALRQAIEGSTGNGTELHLAIDARYQAQLAMAPRAPGDIEVESAGMTLLLDPLSASRANGTQIDVVETSRGAGFQVSNPNAPDAVA